MIHSEIKSSVFGVIWYFASSSCDYCVYALGYNVQGCHCSKHWKVGTMLLRCEEETWYFLISAQRKRMKVISLILQRCNGIVFYFHTVYFQFLYAALVWSLR